MQSGSRASMKCRRRVSLAEVQWNSLVVSMPKYTAFMLSTTHAYQHHRAISTEAVPMTLKLE